MTFSTGRGRARRRALGASLVVVLLLAGGCSDDADDAAETGSVDVVEPTSTSAPPVERPAGPAADLSEALTGGEGVFIGNADPAQLEDGYVEEEFVAAGSAIGYEASGELAADGRWTFEPGPSADYRTRVIIRRPKEPADASGTVVLEWLNVSGGVDADPDYATLHEEITRAGHVWVGVSAQVIGVEGGPVLVRVDVPGAEAAGKGLKAIDPERYGSLEHPGDAYAYDIYTQVARAIREGAVADVVPTYVAAIGESQSAAAMVTYINGVQPLTNAFDGFYVHSRGGSGLVVVAPGEAADLAGSIGGGTTIMRTDTEVPILDIQSENDLLAPLGSAVARQPDTDLFRLWEVAGAAHADRHLVGETAAESIDCGVPINDGPFHIVAKAAFRHFVDWMEGGDPPAEMPLIELTEGDAPEVVRDADGIAVGGVRTPPVDVPTRILSGAKGPSAEVICLLSGSTLPMTADRLAELYPSRAEFEQRYEEALDQAIDAGVVLDEDREAMEGYAHSELVAD